MYIHNNFTLLNQVTLSQPAHNTTTTRIMQSKSDHSQVKMYGNCYVSNRSFKNKEIGNTPIDKIVDLKIKLMPSNIHKPEYKTEGAAAMDLSAAISKPLTLKPMERVILPTGFKLEIPNGYEVQVRARSGLSIKHGITVINGISTIDSDFRGEFLIPLINLGKKEYTIMPGERVAQMIVSKVEKIRLTEVDKLSETKRGERGLGSTGR